MDKLQAYEEWMEARMTKVWRDFIPTTLEQHLAIKYPCVPKKWGSSEKFKVKCSTTLITDENGEAFSPRDQRVFYQLQIGLTLDELVQKLWQRMVNVHF